MSQLLSWAATSGCEVSPKSSEMLRGGGDVRKRLSASHSGRAGMGECVREVRYLLVAPGQEQIGVLVVVPEGPRGRGDHFAKVHVESLLLSCLQICNLQQIAQITEAGPAAVRASRLTAVRTRGWPQ